MNRAAPQRCCYRAAQSGRAPEKDAYLTKCSQFELLCQVIFEISINSSDDCAGGSSTGRAGRQKRRKEAPGVQRLRPPITGLPELLDPPLDNTLHNGRRFKLAQPDIRAVLASSETIAPQKFPKFPSRIRLLPGARADLYLTSVILTCW